MRQVQAAGGNPVQSCAPSAPATGTVPSPDFRSGTRPVVNWAMRWRSATSRFCTGALIWAAARPASSMSPARLRARRPAADVSFTCRLAMATASTWPSGRGIDVAQHRAVAGFADLEDVVGPPRTWMRSSRTVKGFGPSGVA